MNILLYINTLELFLEWWPFLLEALPLLNRTNVGSEKVSADRYFSVLTREALGPPSDGVVIVLASKNTKPLGFVVLLNNTAPFSPKTALCYAVYSNNKCATAVRQLDRETKGWCTLHGYKKMVAASRMIHGATVRWFKNRGFERDCLVFRRTV